MDGEPIQPQATKTSFVYDTRTGKVVHIHQFIPLSRDGSCTNREMEETALKLAPSEWDRAQLGVLHHEKEGDLNPEYQYRVDVSNHELLVEPAPLEPQSAYHRGGKTPP